jgi:UDP-N-acetylmuramoyl-tripeptide--D-alanyl-D-alanine ligase
METIKQLYQQFLASSGVCTDTRQEVKDKLFFALSGDNFNGNKFAEQAMAKGALAAVIDDPAYQKESNYILVDDVLHALQQLALHHRKQFNIPVIGITGTNGKTTTKELIATVLNSKYNIIATRGNLNNHIGVPLTLLRLTKEAEIAVIEMGANHTGEIATLTKLALPTLGIITNIGKAHLEGFGNFEGVKKTKRELYDFLKLNNGAAFVNYDDELLIALSQGMRVIGYGKNAGDVTGHIINQTPNLTLEVAIGKEKSNIKTRLYGSYNFANIMAAIAIGNFFSVPVAKIAESITNYSPENNRSQQLKTQHNKIILDAYNANPVSLSKAITSFWDAKFQNPLLIIGDMFELGKASGEEHQKIVDLLISKAFSEVILVGKDFFNTNHPFKAFETTELAADFLKHYAVTERHILIKGSRGMHLESLTKYL